MLFFTPSAAAFGASCGEEVSEQEGKSHPVLIPCCRVHPAQASAQEKGTDQVWTDGGDEKTATAGTAPNTDRRVSLGRQTSTNTAYSPSATSSVQGHSKRFSPFTHYRALEPILAAGRRIILAPVTGDFAKRGGDQVISVWEGGLEAGGCRCGSGDDAVATTVMQPGPQASAKDHAERCSKGLLGTSVLALKRRRIFSLLQHILATEIPSPASRTRGLGASDRHWQAGNKPCWETRRRNPPKILFV